MAIKNLAPVSRHRPLHEAYAAKLDGSRIIRGRAAPEKPTAPSPKPLILAKLPCVARTEWEDWDRPARAKGA